LKAEDLILSNLHWYEYRLGSLIKPHDDAYKTFEQRCEDNGYNVSVHRVRSEDGFINKVFRVNLSKRLKNSAVVFLHGFVDSSDGWVSNSKDKTFVFLLADLGYDVWVPNMRGNFHSNLHESLDADSDKEFWEHSTYWSSS
jgi:pimeloyl-ACP methyl ester carboxylesterase